MSARPTFYSFAVYPADMDDPSGFDPFVIDVPTLGTQDAAARRAYFTAMALLADTAEPEEFVVHVFENGADGALVTSAGLAK